MGEEGGVVRGESIPEQWRRRRARPPELRFPVVIRGIGRVLALTLFWASRWSLPTFFAVNFVQDMVLILKV